MDEIEIPEAIRENVDLPQKSSSVLSLPLIIGSILCLGTIGLLSAWFFLSSNQLQRQVDNSTVKPTPQPVAPERSTAKSTTKPTVVAPPTAILKKPTSKGLLGHLPYEDAKPSELEAITADGSIKMRSTAAVKFRQMQAAAKADGINLTPISGFRDTQAQEQLFFGVKEQRSQDAAQRAEVSAPPGYSEHHTGYAIDIGDADVPATHAEPEFASTSAFRWLKQNALKYSFELSFPPDNKQGVSYEPWHWRFVGDRESLETFYKVRN